MAWLAFIVCKYQVPYSIPCCNLQSMIMYVQYFFLFIDFMWMVIMKRTCKLWWPTVLSISKKWTITPKKKPTSYKCFCNNLHWVHLKSKVKRMGKFGIRWLVSIVSNLAEVLYAWARSSLLFICKTSLKIPKR
jgi:hypothetical protein